MTRKSRILLFALTASVVFAVVSACRSHRASDPYATLPFRPAVTYNSWNVSIRNTEQEPYLNTSLRIYVGGTLYSMRVGTIRPGETVTHSLLSLTNEHGDKFNPNSVGSTPSSVQISELEVRATFRGHEVHKDFPPPK
ncbi:MAG: hypothetical protein WAM70_07450 [Pyrinomonadaceae bacterium]